MVEEGDSDAKSASLSTTTSGSMVLGMREAEEECSTAAVDVRCRRVRGRWEACVALLESDRWSSVGCVRCSERGSEGGIITAASRGVCVSEADSERRGEGGDDDARSNALGIRTAEGAERGALIRPSNEAPNRPRRT